MAPSQLDDDCASETNSSSHRKRRVLQCGRSRRKLEAKRRNEEFLSAGKETEEVTENPAIKSQQKDTESKCNDSDPIQQNDNWHIVKILNGPRTLELMSIREQYIESQKPWKYPRTIEGWRICWRRAWATYLWTWEGLLIPEKERDADGNIIGVLKKKEDEEHISTDTVKEKATEAATQIAQNVQKNVDTIQQEMPKLLKTAQKLTGITTKEELKQWVGEQLKLGTECLSMFMKGYREGRDDEVDKMLHEYFNEIDEKESNNVTNQASTNVEKSSIDDIATRESVVKPKIERPWGRKARRQNTRRPKQLLTNDSGEAAVKFNAE
jgi:hypothetical protein